MLLRKMEKPAKALWLGIASWLLVFVISLIINLNIVLTPLITGLLSFYYLRRIRKGEVMFEGFELGMLWIALSLVLDIAIIILALGRGFAFFTLWLTWMGYAEIILLTTFVGYALTGRLKRK